MCWLLLTMQKQNLTLTDINKLPRPPAVHYRQKKKGPNSSFNFSIQTQINYINSLQNWESLALLHLPHAGVGTGIHGQ